MRRQPSRFRPTAPPRKRPHGAAARVEQPAAKKRLAFTLIELLVVIAIIMLLTGILVPSLTAAREIGRAAKCLTNLRAMGQAGAIYQTENNQTFWPYRQIQYKSGAPFYVYFWGSDTDPVDRGLSPFMQVAGENADLLLCPELPWGDYVPQGAAIEPTNTYGYNAAFLHPDFWDPGGGTCKSLIDIPRPETLFVFADSGMAWKPAGVPIFQNSAFLEPVAGSYVQMPTNHFRHRGLNNALTADGAAAAYESEGWDVDEKTKLGFVGTENNPHYAQ